MVVHQFEEGPNLLEVLPPGDPPRFLLPVDEPGLVELGEVSVAKFEPDRLLFRAMWSELHGFELLLSAWVIIHECGEDSTPGRVTERPEDLIQIDATRRVAAIVWGHGSGRDAETR